jgi:hypothetical protein
MFQTNAACARRRRTAISKSFGSWQRSLANAVGGGLLCDSRTWELFELFFSLFDKGYPLSQFKPIVSTHDTTVTAF